MSKDAGFDSRRVMIIKERKYMPGLHPEENNPQEIVARSPEMIWYRGLLIETAAT